MGIPNLGCLSFNLLAMDKLVLLFFIALQLLSLKFGNAQRVWAAEMDKDIINQTAYVNVKIYRTGGSKDSIYFSWGDNTEEILSNPFTNLFSSGVYLDTYFAIHHYEDPGIYEIGFVDSFLVENVQNIIDSGNKSIVLKDSLNVLSSNNPISSNQAPLFIGVPGDQTNANNGVVRVVNILQNDIFLSGERWYLEIVPFPTEEYSIPAYTDSLYLFGTTLVWDKPLEPGIYGICIKVREFRKGASDSIFMSTTHRAMMIDIDESMLVSTAVPFVEGLLSLFPNPAAHTLHLQFSNFPLGAATLTFQNAAGQLLYREQVELSARLQQHSVDVSGWPPGVYFLTVQAGGGQVVRRFVKTR